MKKQNINIRIILLVIALILSVLGIIFRTKCSLIFIGGFFSGALALMILRVWLWNTSEFIKGE